MWIFTLTPIRTRISCLFFQQIFIIMVLFCFSRSLVVIVGRKSDETSRRHVNNIWCIIVNSFLSDCTGISPLFKLFFSMGYLSVLFNVIVISTPVNKVRVLKLLSCVLILANTILCLDVHVADDAWLSPFYYFTSHSRPRFCSVHIRTFMRICTYIYIYI